MTLLLPTLAVAFAASCVWLTVRIVNRRERWAKWTLAVVVSVPVLYVASFGPACCLVRRAVISPVSAADAYRPLLRGGLYSWPCRLFYYYGGTDDNGARTAVQLALTAGLEFR